MIRYTTQIRVRYRDTDQMGVVYHGVYLEFFETGRTEFLRDAGMAYSSIEDTGIMLPVLEATLTMKRPARYDDLLTVHAIIREMPTARLKIEYEIYRNDEPLVFGHTIHAFVTAGSMRPVRPPHDFVDTLARLMGRPKLWVKNWSLDLCDLQESAWEWDTDNTDRTDIHRFRTAKNDQPLDNTSLYTLLALTHFVLAQDCGDMPERSEVESILELVLNSQPFDSLTTFYTEEGKCQCDSIILDTLFLYGNESLSVYKDSIEVRFLSDEELKTTERSCYIGYNDFLIVDGKGRAIMAFPRNWKMLWIGFHKDGDKWVLGSNYMIDDY